MIGISSVPELMMFNTVRLSVCNKDGSRSAIGTGFLFTIDVGDGKIQPMIISNRHMFENKDRILEVALHLRDPSKKGLWFGAPPLVRRVNLSEVEFHSNEEIDIACLPAGWTATEDVFSVFLNESHLCTFEEDELQPGLEIWFVGYPAGLSDTTYNLPILRRGWIATHPKIDFEKKKIFLVDANVFNGSSGSPVIARIDNKVKLLGVVSAGFINSQPRKVQGINQEAYVEFAENLSLGCVIKSSVLPEILDVVRAEWNSRKSAGGFGGTE
ncbi:serine protease [bacterium]|nr:serine protease [bacterium]